MRKRPQRLYGALAIGALTALGFPAVRLGAACPELEDLGAADPIYVQADRRDPAAVKEAQQTQISIEALLRLARESAQSQPIKPVGAPSRPWPERKPSEVAGASSLQPGEREAGLRRPTSAKSSPSDPDRVEGETPAQ